MIVYTFLSLAVVQLLVLYPNDELNVLSFSLSHWTFFSWVVAGIFHLWIVLFWRIEMYSGKISSWFGSSGFKIFRSGFIFLFLSAFLPLIPVSFLTGKSMEINPVLRLTGLIVTTPFILWGMFSVFVYFGIDRAVGADHFFSKYRSMTLEKRGIFKYIPNSMYTVVLLMLYHPGLYYESGLGLFFALIHHTFVWVHYFCTEKPDLQEIYGSSKN